MDKTPLQSSLLTAKAFPDSAITFNSTALLAHIRGERARHRLAAAEGRVAHDAWRVPRGACERFGAEVRLFGQDFCCRAAEDREEGERERGRKKEREKTLTEERAGHRHGLRARERAVSADAQALRCLVCADGVGRQAVGVRGAERRDTDRGHDDRAVLAAEIVGVRLHLQTGRRLAAADGGRDGAEGQQRADVVGHALVVRTGAVGADAQTCRQLAEHALLRRADEVAVVAAAALDEAPVALEAGNGHLGSSSFEKRRESWTPTATRAPPSERKRRLVRGEEAINKRRTARAGRSGQSAGGQTKCPKFEVWQAQSMRVMWPCSHFRASRECHRGQWAAWAGANDGPS
eukprot:scaffold7055_cov254-Pinguiococcus_pyrenoidosus.AAC.14